MQGRTAKWLSVTVGVLAIVTLLAGIATRGAQDRPRGGAQPDRTSWTRRSRARTSAGSSTNTCARSSTRSREFEDLPQLAADSQLFRRWKDRDDQVTGGG